jgi:hypothetical protein
MPTRQGTERLYLDEQAANARTAIMQTLHEMKETALRVADVRSSARQHPWLVTGSVVAAGFVAGAVMTRSPQRVASKTQNFAETIEDPGLRGQKPPPAKTTAWFSAIGAALTAAVVTALQAALTAAIASLFVRDEVAAETQPPADILNRGEFENGAE